MSVEGVIQHANRAFCKLVGTGDQSVDGVSLADTPLATYLPGLLKALRSCHVDGKTYEPEEFEKLSAA